MKLLTLLLLLTFNSSDPKTLTIIHKDKPLHIRINEQEILCPCGRTPDIIWMDHDIIEARCQWCIEGEAAYCEDQFNFGK